MYSSVKKGTNKNTKPRTSTSRSLLDSGCLCSRPALTWPHGGPLPLGLSLGPCPWFSLVLTCWPALLTCWPCSALLAGCCGMLLCWGSTALSLAVTRGFCLACSHPAPAPAAPWHCIFYPCCFLHSPFQILSCFVLKETGYNINNFRPSQ